ncbi:hypothetical protein [Luteolibacter sp. LG18]|uniref:hypothetical protein n=1 Tax=Luteolibacter sp. LG18 TaxID=2819286 RepID=UPI002B2B51C7|nr:hypothetical protein llg_41690 [Luteolibacter sp. LG18]
MSLRINGRISRKSEVFAISGSFGQRLIHEIIRGFGRGNGRNLGRYWKVGPAQSIFVPGCWLNEEKDNEVIVLELESENPPLQVPTSKEAIWGN